MRLVANRNVARSRPRVLAPTVALLGVGGSKPAGSDWTFSLGFSSVGPDGETLEYFSVQDIDRTQAARLAEQLAGLLARTKAASPCEKHNDCTRPDGHEAPMKHRPCEKHDDCTRPDGHAGECVSGLELLRLRAGPATRLRVAVLENMRAMLEDAQDDGRACIVCGAEGRPMVPTGARGSRGAQLFACEGH